MRRFDPPKAFAPTGVELPSGLTAGPAGFGSAAGWALVDSAVYAPDASGRLVAFDTARGKTAAVLAHPDLPAAPTPDGGPAAGAAAVPGRPALADIGGRPYVLFPQTVRVPGHGTTQGRTVLAVTAVDPATRAVAWTASVPQSPSDGDAAPIPAVLGVRGTTLVLAVTDRYQQSGTVYALDTTTRALRWSEPGFLGRALAGDTVVAVQPQDQTNTRQTVTGLSVADGAPRWSFPNSLYQTAVTPAGPVFAAVEGRDYASGKAVFRLVDGSGADVIPASQATTRLTTYGMRCAFDDKSVTVCTGVGIVLALDAAGGKELWRLPDQAANRVAPQVTAVWHGAVYGQAAGRPVVLDAVTGQDLATPALAPIQVSATTAVAPDPKTGALHAYPATS